jgi:hypothetical protein
MFSTACGHSVARGLLRFHARYMMLSRQLPDVPFTSQDAARAGFARHDLADLLRRRKIRRVLRNVYLRSDIPDTLASRAAAAALVMRPFEVLCDRTAAWLHGVDTLDIRELEILPPLETVVLTDHTRTRRDGCDGGQRALSPRDICMVGGVRVTTPLRTALDLACGLGRRDALAALDAFMRLHGLTHAQMEVELRRYAGRRGVVQGRELVPLADPRSESAGESWTRLDVIDAGLPMPEPQYWVTDGGRPVYRLDLAYPRSRVAVEYDGREFHEREQAKERDEKRRDWLRRRGWVVIVVTKDDFKGAALEEWLHRLGVALGVRF